MTGWIIAGVVVLLIWFIGCVPLGAGVSRTREEGNRIWLQLGPASITLYPRPKKTPTKPAKEKKSKPAKAKKPKKEGKPRKPFTREQVVTLVRRFLALGLEAAGSFRRKLCIDVLELDLIVGSPDPADAAMDYGKASAALGVLWGPLNEAFRVKDGRARVDVDFQQEHWAVWGRLQMTLTIGQLVWLGLRYGAAALNILRETRRDTNDAEKGGRNDGKAASS